MSYGLTTAGFVRKHLATIKTDLETAFRLAFGDEINLATDSIWGKVIGCVAQPAADLWELLESVYNSQYPATGSGVSLDNSSEMVGVTRIAATRSEVDCSITGFVGTVILAESIAKTEISEDQFQLKTDITLAVSVAVQAVISVKTLATGNYTVTINGTPLTYAATVPPDTAADVSAGLETAIDAGAEPVDATDLGSGVVQIDGDLDADLLPTPFTVAVTANLQIDTVSNLGEFESVETGPVIAFTDTLTTIVSQIYGWTAVTNPKDAVLGVNAETDSAFRARRAYSLAIAGASTVEAIRAKLREITNVTNALVIDNFTDITDGDGRPPHSFEAVVKGGEDADIAAALWADKPAGIRTTSTVGSPVTVNVIDSQGFTQIMTFSRPVEIEMWVDVEYTKYTEETFPSNGEATIAATVLASGIAHDVNNDVMPDRFKGPIFTAVAGLQELTIEVKKTGGSFSPNPFAIDKTEIAVFDSARITVAEAP